MTRRAKIVLHSLEEVPATFASGAEEVAFWETHDFSDELWHQPEPEAPKKRQPVRTANRPETLS